MNKKLLSGCMVLSLCITAMAPIYKQLSLSNNTVHPITEWYGADSGQVSATQQLSSAGYTVTYSPELTDLEALRTEALNQRNSEDLSSRGSIVNEIKDTTAVKAVSITNNTDAKPAAAPSKTTAVRKAATKPAAETAAKIATKPTIKPRTRTKASLSSRGSAGTAYTESSKASAVISTAKSFIGVPYVWGGTSPSGFDCSGYTQYVLGKNGISVPRTAAEQYTVGISVSKSNLQIGDLVFFTTYKEGASHLGFYIGNGNFIHASSSKGVTISSLSNVYYSSHYIGARRVIR